MHPVSVGELDAGPATCGDRDGQHRSRVSGALRLGGPPQVVFFNENTFSFEIVRLGMGTDEHSVKPSSRLETVNDRLGRALDHARFGIKETAYRVELLGGILIRIGLLLLLAVAVAAVLAGLGALAAGLVSNGPSIAESMVSTFMAASLAEKAGMLGLSGVCLLIAGGVLLLAGIDRREKR